MMYRLTELALRASTHLPLGPIDNPLNGVKPSFDFGGAFNTLWKQVLALAWGLALITAIFFIIYNIAQMGAAGDNPNRRAEAKKHVGWSFGAFGALAALGALIGAILAAVS